MADVGDFRRAVTGATVPPGEDSTRALLSTLDAKAALAGIARDRDDARASLIQVDRVTKAAKARADASDAALERMQAHNADLFAGAGKVIGRLEAAKPTGRPDTDAAAIEPDSRAAWEAGR